MSAYPISEEFEKEIAQALPADLGFIETPDLSKMAARGEVLEKMANYIGETEHAGLEGFEESEDEILARAEDLRSLTLRRDEEHGDPIFAEGTTAEERQMFLDGEKDSRAAFRESLLKFAAKFMADFARTL